MNNPNPLIPQGTFQAQASKGASNVRIAVATIVAIHVVFFGGLLLQGCKRDSSTAILGSETNSAAVTNFNLPPIETSTYYSNPAALPPDSSNRMFASGNAATPDYSAASNAPTVRDTLAPSSLNTGASGMTPAAESTGAAEKEYTIQRGDTYAKIAVANGTTVNAIRKANPAIDPAKLRPGMKIQVPAGTLAGGGSSASQAPAGGNESAASPNGSGGSGTSYTVKQGDNLTKIARANNVTLAQLRAANNLKTSNVRVGQKLKIPAASAHTNAAAKPGAKKASTNSNGL